MNNRYYKHNKYNRNAAIEHVKAYKKLEQRLGTIVTDVKNIFFNLDNQSKTRLFDKYEKQYGYKAREYAENTFIAWKTEQTKMSGQTAERLLNLVPEFIHVNKRNELVKKLCSNHQSVKRLSIEIDLLDPTPGINSFYSSVEQFKNVELIKQLPQHVMDTLKWLNNEDITALRAVLGEVDKINAEHIAVLSVKEFNNIKSVIDRNGSSDASFDINFPTGILTVYFKQPSMFRKIMKFFS